MMKWLSLLALLSLGAPMAAAQPPAESAIKTMTGWFSDAECAAPRLARGVFAPNGAECVKRCLARGVKAVFIADQAKAAFAVTNYPNVANDVGYYVELTGVVDAAAKTISVTSVKQLESVGAMCRLPRKGTQQ